MIPGGYEWTPVLGTRSLSPRFPPVTQKSKVLTPRSLSVSANVRSVPVNCSPVGRCVKSEEAAPFQRVNAKRRGPI